MTKVLITGVAGFMGSHLADSFLERGYQVCGIDSLVGGYLENIPAGVEFLQADLDDLDRVEPLFEGTNLVVHAACTAYEGLSVFSPAFVVRNTFQITATVMSLSVKYRIKKIVFLSSMARYGEQNVDKYVESLIPKPQDPYGIAKYASEMLISNLSSTHGIEFVTLVPHNIIGPRQRYNDPYRNVVSIMINRMLQGKQPVIYGDGEQTRSFTFMNDVINPCIVAAETPSVNGEVINVGPDEDFITINELAGRLGDLMNFKVKPIYVEPRPQEVRHAVCSADKARSLLNYRTTTSLEDGLKELISWISSKGPKPFEYNMPLEINNELTPKTWSNRLM